jgi:hypothetical protein
MLATRTYGHSMPTSGEAPELSVFICASYDSTVGRGNEFSCAIRWYMDMLALLA